MKIIKIAESQYPHALGVLRAACDMVMDQLELTNDFIDKGWIQDFGKVKERNEKLLKDLKKHMLLSEKFLHADAQGKEFGEVYKMVDNDLANEQGVSDEIS